LSDRTAPKHRARRGPETIHDRERKRANAAVRPAAGATNATGTIGKVAETLLDALASRWQEVWSMRTLVVDDEQLIARALGRGLSGEVIVESNGSAALARIASDREHGRKFDVVIADFQMPGMTGIELFTAIAEDSAVRILMSGTSEMPASPWWYSILKPFTLAELRELIATAMASRAA
jgi:CheY-like chemotaxis protein